MHGDWERREKRPLAGMHKVGGCAKNGRYCGHQLSGGREEGRDYLQRIGWPPLDA